MARAPAAAIAARGAADLSCYERVKRQLAGRRRASIQEYADAKTEVMARACE
jgi:GrpB-like predicted nucleotidyltransferase (UPF0157 family)